MKTIEINLYSFAELSDEAKEKALENYANSTEYFWANDSIKSLEKGIEHFNCYLQNYRIDFLEPYRNSVTIDYPEIDFTKKELKSLVLSMGSYDKKTLRGHGECKFTGVCFDEDFADGVRKAFFSGEIDLKELILSGVSSWEDAVKKDYEFEFTAEFYTDHCDINNIEFTEDGEKY